MELFLSGIKAIPGDIYEACDIDGANLLQRLFYVTIPMLKETFIINIVLVVTGVFKIYELVYQMTGGGPAHQSELLTSYVFYSIYIQKVWIWNGNCGCNSVTFNSGLIFLY